MFTGIVQELGTIQSITPLSEGREFTISASSNLLENSVIGDSISINGVCSTITTLSNRTFSVQYLEETLKKTTFDQSCENDTVNLELSLTPTSKMGGHFVTGHIDETCRIHSLKKGTPFGEIQVEINPEKKAYLIEKGSITIDGISLTIGALTDTIFTCYLIPHTIDSTTLSTKKAGDLLNIEYDIIGKYLHRFYTLDH